MNERLPVYAPPESFKPIIGAPILTAISITLQIFSACVSDNAPQNSKVLSENKLIVRLWFHIQL
jgi:hypothetical protein